MSSNVVQTSTLLRHGAIAIEEQDAYCAVIFKTAKEAKKYFEANQPSIVSPRQMHCRRIESSIPFEAHSQKTEVKRFLVV
ncbi:MAG: hypothetical protein KGJ02_00355 [Verrucomicrobiota bacterium]|nr:hypothetical protein [Verrucomicrobiota bacterium]